MQRALRRHVHELAAGALCPALALAIAAVAAATARAGVPLPHLRRSAPPRPPRPAGQLLVTGAHARPRSPCGACARRPASFVAGALGAVCSGAGETCEAGGARGLPARGAWRPTRRCTGGREEGGRGSDSPRLIDRSGLRLSRTVRRSRREVTIRPTTVKLVILEPAHPAPRAPRPRGRRTARSLRSCASAAHCHGPPRAPAAAGILGGCAVRRPLLLLV